jgi:hypothetical protein
MIKISSRIFFAVLFVGLINTSFANEELDALLGGLVYDPTKTYAAKSAVMISVSDGEIYTSKITVPAAADGSNGPNGANAATYWGDSTLTTNQFKADNPKFLDELPTDIDTTELSKQVGSLTNPSSSLVTLTGISTRGTISKDKAMTGGILIEGTANKKVVFMAKGYSMFVSDNVQNYADDLVMQILSFNSSTSSWDDQGTFDDWGSVSKSTTTSGATVENVSTIDPSINPEITLLQGAKEAGVVLTLPAGYHAAIVTSKSSSLQEGIVEAYEVKGSIDDSLSALTGISTRGPISKDKAMTGGILIEGTANKKVVFMAKGYSMFVSDNVQNYADDLVMQILSFNSSTSSWDDQGTFDDWGSVSTSATTSGATVENVSTIDSAKNPEITLLQGAKEAGVVLTLPPGYHAAIVTSKSSSIQEGIVEAYEVK